MRTIKNQSGRNTLLGATKVWLEFQVNRILFSGANRVVFLKITLVWLLSRWKGDVGGWVEDGGRVVVAGSCCSIPYGFWVSAGVFDWCW